MTGLPRPLWAIAIFIATPAFASAPVDAGPNAISEERSAPAVSPATLAADDLVLLEVRSDGETISDGIGAYASLGGVYLPLGELSRLLGIAIIVEPEMARATGWIGSKDRTFIMDLMLRTAMFDNRTLRFSQQDAILLSREIYVRADVLSGLIPVRFSPDIRQLSLDIVALERLPFQEKADRALRRSSVAEGPTDALSTRITTPYALATPPAADIQIEGSFAEPGTRARGRYDVRLAGDLLYSKMQIAASSNDRLGLSNVNILLERQDAAGEALGRFGFTRAAIGDVLTPSLSLGAQGESGRGLFLTTEALFQSSIFEQTNLRGPIADGYDVELYVNEVLRGSQTAPRDNLYDFREVPLTFGLNVIRLIFYGPNGERSEEVRRINVGGGQVPPGRTEFAIGAVEEGKALIEVGAPGNFGTGPGFSRFQLVGRVAHGLSTSTTLTGGFARYQPNSGRPREMGVAGLRTSLLSMATQFDVAADSRGGTALGLGLAGRLGPASFLFRQNEYSGGFLDDSLPGAAFGEPLRRSTDGHVDLNVSIANRGIPFSFTFRRDQQRDGGRSTNLDGRASVAIGQYLFSSSLSYQAVANDGRTVVENARGSLDVSGIIQSSWQMRAGALYQIAPRTRLTDAFFSLDRALDDRAALRLAASRNFGRNAASSVQASASFRMPFGDLSFDTRYLSRPNDTMFGIRLSFGVIFNPLKARYELTRPGAATGGGIAIRTRQMGSNAEGGRPVEGIRFSAGSVSSVTDREGIALLTGLGSGTTSRIDIDLSALEDPYLIASARSFATVPRLGRIAQTELNISTAGEALLRAMFDDGSGKLRGLSALRLQLRPVASPDKVQMAGTTEYDGALYFEGIPPGEYALEIEREQAERLGLAIKLQRNLTIPEGGGYVGETQLVVIAQKANR